MAYWRPIALACAVLMFTVAETASADAETRPTIERLVNEQAAAWSAGDADAVAASFTADAEFIVPGHRWRGRKAIRGAAAGYFATGQVASVEIERVLVDGSWGVVLWRWSEHDAEGANESLADDAIVLRLDGDKIAYWREFIDRETPAKQKPVAAPADEP
ncbi:hypothetical protein LYNGBM3L_75650 [Moorena producens 3L]|uniref:SnoaL-like domain-containing protein n=1 Tax=Moorena producens 3L TaxID=489825 RepID=F4XRE6_9CYAN|nr:nuclear transport factor 2 family protein [Moorena producens]EGJ32838.1 hypothetical protein LYNGBM3L_75650 [Moorena producens 3L]OLT56256.1 hypothetical protein BI334_32565 [Moorena producens 3L]